MCESQIAELFAIIGVCTVGWIAKDIIEDNALDIRDWWKA